MIPRTLAGAASFIFGGILAAGTLGARAASAQEQELVDLINHYRDAPHTCDGKSVQPAGPLTPEPALERVDLSRGTPLDEALKQANYQASRVQAMSITGPASATAAMALLERAYCRMLSNRNYSAIGVSRQGNTWRVIFAQPLLSSDLGNWEQAGKEVLQLVNSARQSPRACGSRQFSAAPPLAWNGTLAAAARTHSVNMARQNYFSHTGKDGSDVGARAQAAGYSWRRVGENIAAGQGSPQQVVSGWLASPGHCANIMNQSFSEMGTAYATNPDSDATIYWTQVFATPR